MGDRTWVNLYVPAELADATREIFSADPPTSDDLSDNPALHCFGFEEVNYGNLPSLEELQHAGIAFDSSWEAGCEYSSGTASLRFTPEGEAIRKEIYDNDSGVDLYKLLEVMDDHEALRKLILEQKERLYVLPWDNQVAYGKIYRTMQLLSPTPTES